MLNKLALTLIASAKRVLNYQIDRQFKRMHATFDTIKQASRTKQRRVDDAKHQFDLSLAVADMRYKDVTDKAKRKRMDAHNAAMDATEILAKIQ